MTLRLIFQNPVTIYIACFLYSSHSYIAYMFIVVELSASAKLMISNLFIIRRIEDGVFFPHDVFCSVIELEVCL